MSLQNQSNQDIQHAVAQAKMISSVFDSLFLTKDELRVKAKRIEEENNRWLRINKN